MTPYPTLEAEPDDKNLVILQSLICLLREKNIHTNVDFYSGTVYRALGIPDDLFTPVFAISRMSVWAAHVLEQYGHNRIIRPRAEYPGPNDRPSPPLD